MGTDYLGLQRELGSLLGLAGDMALRGQGGHERTIKPDGSVVTNVDVEIERFLRPRVLELTPGAGLWGEETGHTPQTEEGLWVVDPIDGTTNYTHGIPMWGVTAAFLCQGQIQVGAFVLPALGETYLAVRGHGATMNGVPIEGVQVGEIKPKDLVAHGDSKLRWIGRVPGKPRHVGSFVVEAGYTALQRFRAMAAGTVSLYDAAAGILVCREVGCEIREMGGAAWDESEWLDGDRCRPFMIGPPGNQTQFGPELAVY